MVMGVDTVGMSKRKRIVLVAVAVVAAFAVGGVVARWDQLFGSEPVSAVSTKPRVAEVAGKLGCSPEISSTTRMYARESGSCNWDGQRITIEVFESDELRDKYVEVGKSFGGNYAAGHGWLVFGDSPDAIARAAERLGGKVI